MGYSMNMSEEKKPTIKILLPKGWRKFRIKTVKETKSKAGNTMFVIEAEDHETGYIDTWYAIAEKGKRWFLKSILSACGCEAAQDGVYNWDIPDILGKDVLGFITHEESEWINREGEKVKQTQHRVSDIKESVVETKTQSESVNPEEIAWDET